MKFPYLDSYVISAPEEPGRAKTVICSTPSFDPHVIHFTLPLGATMTSMTSEAPEDPYLWLEDVTGEEALDWVRARNEPTKAEYCSGEFGAEFEQMRNEALEVLDTDTRIPYVRRRGEY